MLLTKWVTAEKVRDVIGNNPTIFEYDLEEIEEKIRFLTYTMNVSSYRVAMTPKSLTYDLDFFTLRRDNVNMTRSRINVPCSGLSSCLGVVTTDTLTRGPGLLYRQRPAPCST